jgi:hypothetical protein
MGYFGDARDFSVISCYFQAIAAFTLIFLQISD